jgi:hypothetical protein
MSNTLTCAKCTKTFNDLGKALAHAQREHGITRQQAQNEIKLHRRR